MHIDKEGILPAKYLDGFFVQFSLVARPSDGLTLGVRLAKHPLTDEMFRGIDQVRARMTIQFIVGHQHQPPRAVHSQYDSRILYGGLDQVCFLTEMPLMPLGAATTEVAQAVVTSV